MAGAEPQLRAAVTRLDTGEGDAEAGRRYPLNAAQ